MADRRVYLVAYLGAGLSGYIDDRTDFAAARVVIKPVAAARRHLTVLNLAVADVPQKMLEAAVRLVMTGTPPKAFRVVLDHWIASIDRILIGASEPVAGFRRCQDMLLDGLRDYTLDLPARDAAVRPHVTLGYGRPATRGVREIDGLSWKVDALTLIVSHHGEGRHEPIDHWQLAA
jgi:2'-5' RNA ligase